MTLHEKHYKAVEDATAGLFDEREDYLSARGKVAKDSAEITKGYMKGFAKWCSINGWNHNSANCIWWKLREEYKTTDQLIEIYLKEIESK